MRNNYHMFLLICGAIIMASLPSLRPTQAETAQNGSASVMLYHRFGEDDTPSTNVRLAQFDRHLEQLKSGTFSFPTLPDLVARLSDERGVEDHSILITVDDAYLSVFTEAWPRLKKLGIPLAVFVSTDEADYPGDVYMSWDQLRQLKREGVYIGHHGASHKSLIELSVDEARADLERANKRFMEELGEIPDILAWPFGEFSIEVKQMVLEMGFRAAFAQSSGGLGATSPMFALPRFSINERYGTKERFDLVLKARTLPVRDVLPENPVLNNAANPPLFGFTLTQDVPKVHLLACYPSNSDKAAKVLVIGKNRIEVRFDKPFPAGRGRVNCTLPSDDGRWYWFGMPFFVKSP